MRGLILVVLVALAAPTAAASWGQRGGDGGRTSALQGGGPEWDEVALILQPPSGETWGLHDDPGHPSAGTLLLVGDELLTTTRSSIVAISLATGTLRTIAPLTEAPAVPGAPDLSAYALEDWASDGTDLFVIGTHSPDLRIIPLDGSPERTVRILDSAPSVCWMALDHELAIACLASAAGDPFVTYSASLRLIVQLRALDGSLIWSWTRETDPDAARSLATRFDDANPTNRWLTGITLTTDRVVASTATLASIRPEGPENLGGGEFFWTGSSLDRETGRVVETFGTGRTDLAPAPFPDPTSFRPVPLVADATHQVRLDVTSYEAGGSLDPAPFANVSAYGQLLRLVRLPDGAVSVWKPAMSADRVVIATDAHLLGLDRAGNKLWETALPLASNELGGPVIDEDRVYLGLGGAAGDGRDLEAAALWAFDVANGAPLWSHELPGELLAIAGGNGTLAVMTSGARQERVITVFGHTPASIAPRPRVSLDYPEPADEVMVDLSASSPGLYGPATRYKAVWGDGEVTEWTTELRLTHAYGSVGDYDAVLFVGNDAGQTSAFKVTFHVGRTPPQTLLQEQFARENQDRTFFILGLIVTAVFAGAGLLRVQRRRSILARELAALDAAVKDAPADPHALDALLDERRLHARALLLGGKIDEGQHAVLAARVEELARAARMDVVQHQLDFLPFRHVRALREMLKDGRISSIERAHYLTMLEADATLTPEYKARVRVVVEAWAAHDGGAG